MVQSSRECVVKDCEVDLNVMKVNAHMSGPKSCSVSIQTRVNIDPDTAYRLLIHPQNHQIFENQQPARKRTILYDDGITQKVEVEQEAKWRFSIFSGSFLVHIVVEQNRRLRQVSYSMLSSGFMTRFEGSWNLHPVPENSVAINAANTPNDGAFKSRNAFNVGSVNENRFAGLMDERRRMNARIEKGHKGCIVELKQTHELSFRPPAAVNHLIMAVSSHVAGRVLSDFITESQKIIDGRPTIPDIMFIHQSGMNRMYFRPSNMETIPLLKWVSSLRQSFNTESSLCVDTVDKLMRCSRFL